MDIESVIMMVNEGRQTQVAEFKLKLEQLESERKCFLQDSDAKLKQIDEVLNQMDKPLRNVVQYDVDEDEVWCSPRQELRRTTFPVRVQLMGGNSKEECIRLLKKIVAFIEKDVDFQKHFK